MLKTNFQQELHFTGTLQNGSSGTSVRRVQEWLCLNALHFPNSALTTALDSEFGPATERAVKNFQAVRKLPKTGVVTPELFAGLSEPLARAFQTQPTTPDIRKAVVQLAQAHLKQRSAELQTDNAQNLGPWVRSYCNGLDGVAFKWCAGFVQSVLDQAASAFGRQLTAIMSPTLSCDELAMSGQQTGRLTKSADLRKNPKSIRPGDVFLLRNPVNNDWFHTGLITAVAGDVVETIEGNTDSKGGSNGTAVFTRVRNFQKTTLDLFSIDGL